MELEGTQAPQRDLAASPIFSSDKVVGEEWADEEVAANRRNHPRP